MTATLSLSNELVKSLDSQANYHKVSWQQWAVMILSQAAETSNGETVWQNLNERRLHLIHKKFDNGLNEYESNELSALNALADQRLRTMDEQRLEWLQQYDELAGKLDQ